MSEPIKIIVLAQTEEAAAKIKNFVAGSTEGLREIGPAMSEADQEVQRYNETLKMMAVRQEEARRAALLAAAESEDLWKSVRPSTSSAEQEQERYNRALELMAIRQEQNKRAALDSAAANESVWRQIREQQQSAANSQFARYDKFGQPLGDFAQVPQKIREGSQELSKFTRNSFNARMGLLELEHTARSTVDLLLVGGSPRMLLAQAPQLIQSLSLMGVALTTVGSGLLALTPLVISGSEAFSAYRARVAEADAEQRAFAQTQDLIARNLAALNKARNLNLISPDDAQFIERMLMIGSSSALRAGMARLSELGISQGAIDNYDKLQKLEKQMQQNILQGLDAEKAKASEVYQQRLDEISKLDNAGQVDHAEAEKARQLAMDEFNARSSAIEAQKQKQNEAQLIKQIDDDVFFHQQRQGKLSADAEFNYRVDRFRQAAKEGKVSQDGLTSYVIDQEKKRVAAVAAENATEEQRMKLQQQQVLLEQELRRSRAQTRLHGIETNPFLGESAKAIASLGPISDLMQANEKSIGLYTYQAATTSDDSARIQALTKVNELTQQQVDLQRQLNAAKGDNSFTYQLGLAVTHLEDMNNLAKETAQAFENTFNNAIATVSNGITGLIMGTMTWRQFLSDIPREILTQIIGAIVEMGLRWVATQIMMATVGRSIQAAALAESAPIAGAYSAIWAVPATLSTIASYGAAAAAAPGLIGIAELSTLATAAFAEGGRPVPGEIALVGERGPELFVPDQSGTIIPNHVLSQMSQQPGGSPGAASAQGSVLNLHVYDRRPHPRDYFNSPEGENHFVELARRNRLKIGIRP